MPAGRIRHSPDGWQLTGNRAVLRHGRFNGGDVRWRANRSPGGYIHHFASGLRRSPWVGRPLELAAVLTSFALVLLHQVGQGTQWRVPVIGGNEGRNDDPGVLLLYKVGHSRLNIAAKVTVMKQDMPAW